MKTLFSFFTLVNKLLPVIFVILFFSFKGSASPKVEYVCEDGIELRLETIEDADGIKIVKVSDGETVWFRVIAAITTAFLPEIVNQICVKVTGDAKACEVVYAVTSALVSLKGRSINRAISRNGITNDGCEAIRMKIKTLNSNKLELECLGGCNLENTIWERN